LNKTSAVSAAKGGSPRPACKNGHHNYSYGVGMLSHGGYDPWEQIDKQAYCTYDDPKAEPNKLLDRRIIRIKRFEQITTSLRVIG
jgi:hypothetical protein